MLKSLISNSRRKQFLNLLIFYAAFLWFRTYASAVLGPYFLERNITLNQMIMANALYFMIGSVWLAVFRTYYSRLSWFLAQVVSIFGIIIAMKTTTVSLYYLYVIALGVGSILYFTPYNIAHFRLTPGHRNSFSAAIMFSVIPVISFLAPFIAGFLAQISYRYIWYGSLLFFIITAVLANFQTNFIYKIKFKKDLVYLRATWKLLILQGLWEPIVFGVISVFTLKFIKTPLDFGSFLSYLGLVAILANLFLGHISDQQKNRVKFLAPAAVALGLTTIFLPLAVRSLIPWFIVAGLINFISPLFWNLSTAYFVDLQPEVIKSMPAREWILATSRTVGFLLVYLNFSFVYFLGVMMLLYPLVLLYNTKHAVRS